MYCSKDTDHTNSKLEIYQMPTQKVNLKSVSKPSRQ